MFGAPCPHICKKPLRRFHLTCLTCPRRRDAEGTGKWVRYKAAHLVLYSPSGRGVLLPRNYKSYILTYTDNMSHLRRMIIKTLLTITERIAEW